MLHQLPHNNNRNIDSTIPKDYEFVSDNQSHQNVVGKAIQPSSNDWDEKVYFEVGSDEVICSDQYSNRDCGINVHVIQNFMVDNATDKDCEMLQSQKCQLDKGDSKMDLYCRFLMKQKDVSTENVLHGHTDVSCRNNCKTLNRCNDKLSTDENLEATVGLQELNSRSSISKDVDLSDFSDAATSDANEDIKSKIEQNVYWKEENSRNNSSLVKKPSFTSHPVMNCSVRCIQMNGINSELEETQKDNNVVLYSGILKNQHIEKCNNCLDDYLQLSNANDDVKMKAHQCDDKKDPLLLQDDCSVDYISLDSPGNLYSLAAEDQQKQAISLSGPERYVRSSSMDSDILSLNDFDNAKDLFPAHTSLYDNYQPMHEGSQPMQDTSQLMFNSSKPMQDSSKSIQDGYQSMPAGSESMLKSSQPMQDSSQQMYDSSQSMHTSSQPALSSAVPATFNDSMSQEGKASGIADSTENVMFKLGNANLTATTTLSSSVLSPGGSSTSQDGNSASTPRSTDHPLSNGERQQQKLILLQDTWSADAVEMGRNNSDFTDAEMGRNSANFIYAVEMERNSADFTDAVEMGRNSADFTDILKCAVSEISCLPLLSQAIDSSPSPSYFHDSHEPQADSRHIKSILNTYVSHKLKTDAGDDGINDIADEFALILSNSRKRTATNKDPSAIPLKKLYLAETNSMSCSKKQCVTNMGKVDSNCAWSRPKVKPIVQNQDAALVLCSICDTSNPSARTIQCKNAHAICQTCLEDHVRLVMASNQVHLSCPKMSCSAVISQDSLPPVLPSLVIDILSDNFRLKEQKATTKAVKKMQELVICPRCACPGMLDERTIQFVCTTCNYNSCRYCKATWAHYDEHDGCFLLNFVGVECLKNIVKVPRNWDMNLTAFNKNYLQVNIRLDSTEGSTVAAFFEKTAAFGTHVVQVFRIQNRKLWEKYVLKRKHIEEEIGSAELKEKFLFHGTKAENIVSICSEGFDIRVPTANGALLGKGIYFSTTARYSEKYVDGSKMMYLARVLCGWSQQGQKLLTRPSYHNTVRRMYDSCVNDIASPTIFTIFDNSQCYPEYLIQFDNQSPANTRK